jgi:hypothetical protein
MVDFKAQAEIAVILILIIVGGISVYYAFQSEIIPTSILGTGEEQKSVRDSVINMIRDGSYSTLHTLNMYGGYLKPQPRSVDYAGKKRNYWQTYTGEIIYPDIEKNFVTGLTEYLVKNKDGLQKSLEDKGVVLGDVSVSANILENKIVIEVKMPTIVKNRTIDDTYRIEMQSRIGEIFELSKKILEASINVNERPFEQATISNMWLENFKNPYKMPIGLLPGYGCNPMIYSKDWNEIKPIVQNIVEKTVSSACISGYEKCAQAKNILPPEIKLDKIYDGIDINFDLPENFEFNKITLQFNPNPIYQEAHPVEYFGNKYCERDNVEVKYRINYPVVVIITDTLTKDPFIFVMDIFVDANAPGDFSKKTEYDKENIIHSYICDKKDCEMSLKVVRVYSDEPLSNVGVKFAGCTIGKTNENGVLEASIPCGSGTLSLVKKGFAVFKEDVSSDELKNLKIQLKKNYQVPIFLYEAVIEKTDESYKIAKSGLQTLKSSSISEIRFVPVKIKEDDMSYLTKPTVIIAMRPADRVNLAEGYYIVNTFLRLGSESQSVGGFVSTNAYFVNENAQENGFHIVLPRYEDITTLPEEEIFTLFSQTFPNLLEKCKLGPVSSEKPTLQQDCEYKISELEGGS